MNCDPERLSHFRDGELSPEEARQVRAHLAGCRRCTERLAEYDEIERSVRRLNAGPPSSELRRRIYARVDQRRRRKAGAWTRRGLLTPLALAGTTAVLIVAGLVVVPLLTAGAPPIMTAAFAVQESPDSLEGLRLELVFDRAVAPDSVREAIQIEPPLPIEQRVLDNKVELIPTAPLQPNASYRLIVSNVRDLRGHGQPAPVVLSLSAGPDPILIQESTPAPQPAAEPAVAEVAEARVSEGSSLQAAAESLLESSRSARPLIASEPALGRFVPAPAVPAGREVLGAGLPIGAPLPGGRAAAPATPHDLQALLAAMPDLRLQLGRPGGPSRLLHLSEQTYQGGGMLARADADEVIVLVRGDGRWSSFANGWRPGDVLAPIGARPPGTLEPLRGFGRVWRDQPSVRLQLGWPVYEERGGEASLQRFERGLLIQSPHGVLYALFDDGTWRTLPSPNS